MKTYEHVIIVPKTNRKTPKPIKYTINGYGCWLCTSHCSSTGYSKILSNGKLITIAKYLYQLKNGYIQDKQIIANKCNNHLCINPEHWKLCTRTDLMQMVYEKGETKALKLDEMQVAQIRNSSQSHTDLANKYNVTASQIYAIKNNKSWKHLNGISVKSIPKNQKFTDEIKSEIKNSKLSFMEISKKYDIDISQLSRIRHGKMWKDIL